ncbi:MAG: DUF3800 domain-containing protein [Acidobacteria bacterium]|nr:DUF3800 domain-containing protein [Acidobacteriota bacterium]
MQLIFIDETGDDKHSDYFGLSLATINYTKYAKVKEDFQRILKKGKWDPKVEFKGAFLFSAKKGDTSISIDKRIELAEQILDLTTSKANSRMKFHYVRHSAPAAEHGKEYLRILPILLAKLPKAPSGAGKNLAYFCCDYRSDINLSELNDIVVPAIKERGYTLIEQVSMLHSGCETIGLLYADIIGYLAARIHNISNDSELFEGLNQEELQKNGKLKKLRSSKSLISKVKHIQQYEVRV